MSNRPIQALIEDIDRVEAEQEAALEPGSEMIMLPIPMETYRALSDAAAKKNMTVAEVISKAFSLAVQGDLGSELGEEGAGHD